ncbi:microbial collagenase [Trema orientale]|uniref:Microbial collagenase n=1 Tax=Trema orientale TaxID=63057 RepID=A0A2P5AAE9_TREOI|nr:microbial collagenase [Trema orientale]
MGSEAASLQLVSSALGNWVALNSSPKSIGTSSFSPRNSLLANPISLNLHRFHRARTQATLDEQSATAPLQTQPNREVEESVKVLKNAAKTRRVPNEEILSALSVIEKAKIDPSNFLDTLGGSESPGRTWMLIFTAEKQLDSGRYFPLTAVQRFDAAAKRIENGVYLGPVGALTFEGRFSWKKRILAFIFESIRIKVGPLNPLEISLGQKDDREPSNKDPFFIWFYIDEEIAVARGRSGGTAFWCRCRRVPT